jgi:Ni/Co efflux regulator RcnB
MSNVFLTRESQGGTRKATGDAQHNHNKNMTTSASLKAPRTQNKSDRWCPIPCLHVRPHSLRNISRQASISTKKFSIWRPKRRMTQIFRKRHKIVDWARAAIIDRLWFCKRLSAFADPKDILQTYYAFSS